ncbi:cysteine synthase [Staphylothermus marinus F1]|uniref:Cysteine synthase n=1 Tax=Staphylothermus marinus (strain ATCC 43588 / DSM 3639 / JCM 9404 / F1) TaxID=399550 RepID=A3DMC5_STAMF|nr:PLP-dependent cysteine synthase family protein [Staphylothermus marinus]ABN69785.1 cysteine synthase [Staphylothermus marinus F1]
MSEKRFILKVFRNPMEMLPHIWPTPLVFLPSLSDKDREVYGKLEYFNPFSHSIKDRAVWNMVVKAYQECIECKKLYEATSGNVGIALACISNLLGIKFRAYIPKNTPRITEILLKMLGAEVIRTEYETINQEFIEYVRNAAEKDNALNLNQFTNDNNFEVHYKYTARELEEQLKVINKVPPTAIIASIGTSGHIGGISTYFKEKYGNSVKIIGVVPAKGSVIPGIKRLETNPKWYSKDKVDRVIEITKEEAVKQVLKIARKDGLLLGLSSGAVAAAYEHIRQEYDRGVFILVFPDDSFKYLEIFGDYLRMHPNNV